MTDLKTWTYYIAIISWFRVINVEFKTRLIKEDDKNDKNRAYGRGECVEYES